MIRSLRGRGVILSRPQCVLSLHCPVQRWRTSHFRGYATSKSSPSFSGRKQPATGDVFRKAKKTDNGSKLHEKPLEPSTPKRLRRFGLSPRRIIFASIFSYLCYRLYNWQINPGRSLILNGRYFTPFILQSKDQVSSTSGVFNLLSLPAGQSTYNVDEAWKLGVWSVQVMQPELQIARSYTPLPPDNQSPPEQIRLYVRKEPQGEVSGFLHKLMPGSIVHLRGPHPEYVIPDDVKEIVFVAGGTGIAPALQVVHSLFYARERPKEATPKVTILWANRRREDSYSERHSNAVDKLRASIVARVRKGMHVGSTAGPSTSASLMNNDVQSQFSSEQTTIVQKLEELNALHSDKISVEYFVDEENSFITKSALREKLSTRGTKLDNAEGSKKIILVAGPDGFVEAFAGPKQMKGGKEIQGPLGGYLQEINPKEWTIWKL